VNGLDYVVLFAVLLGIAGYGIWHTRHKRDLSTYVKGHGTARWVVIGLSVMATQASAITFLSTPGQGYTDGLGFVQNYFGAPFALIYADKAEPGAIVLGEKELSMLRTLRNQAVMAFRQASGG